MIDFTDNYQKGDIILQYEVVTGRCRYLGKTKQDAISCFKRASKPGETPILFQYHLVRHNDLINLAKCC